MKNTTRVMAQLQRRLNDIKERESVALNGEIPPFGEYISERDLRDAWEAGAVSKATLYHSAGDSIVTTVLMGLFGEILGVEGYERKIEETSDRVASEKGEKGK